MLDKLNKFGPGIVGIAFITLMTWAMATRNAEVLTAIMFVMLFAIVAMLCWTLPERLMRSKNLKREGP